MNRDGLICPFYLPIGFPLQFKNHTMNVDEFKWISISILPLSNRGSPPKLCDRGLCIELQKMLGPSRLTTVRVR